jgi:hypothetical protein
MGGIGSNADFTAFKKFYCTICVPYPLGKNLFLNTPRSDIMTLLCENIFDAGSPPKMLNRQKVIVLALAGLKPFMK